MSVYVCQVFVFFDDFHLCTVKLTEFKKSKKQSSAETS